MNNIEKRQENKITIYEKTVHEFGLFKHIVDLWCFPFNFVIKCRQVYNTIKKQNGLNRIATFQNKIFFFDISQFAPKQNTIDKFYLYKKATILYVNMFKKSHTHTHSIMIIW